MLELAIVGALFCVSGAAALVYQVAWQRILVLHTGVGVYSVALIVAAFMAGLGLGSQIGGVQSARLSPRRALVVFGFLELGVAAFAATSCFLYYDVLYLRAGALYENPLTAALAQLAALLLPTTLMGMSLPFLVRAMVREAASADRTIGYLYGLNVVGASLGSFLTPWLLIRAWGIDGAVLAGAAASFSVGAGAFALLQIAPPPDARAEVESGALRSPPPSIQDASRRLRFGAWLLLYALSGFVSLSLEILWFRIVDVAVKSTAFTFGTVLGIYLLGLAAGGLAGTVFAHRVSRPLRAFLVCQCLLVLYSACGVCLLAALPTDWPVYRWFHEYWPRYEGFQLGIQWDPLAFLRLYVLLPGLLYLVPTMLMGLSFVVLQRATQDDVRTSGRKVGSLQAANIVGGVLGSLGVGLLTLTWLGTTGTLRLLTASGLVFAAIGIRHHGARTFGTFAAALLALVGLLPSQRALWLRLHGTSQALVEEDATGVVAIAEGGPKRWQMMVNGKGISWLPFGGVHSLMGAAPAIVHAKPLDVAIIGLGSADTAWAASCRPETTNLVVYEISSPQPRLLRAFAAEQPFPELSRFLADERVRVLIEDGRNALERGRASYDVIEADPLPPGGSGSGNLYSLEFFAGCARRLKPGGIMCTWSPTPRVYATFCRVFPHVLEFTHGQFQFLLGSNDPLALDLPAWLARLETEALRSHLGPAVTEETRQSLKTARAARPTEELDIEPNRDLFPRDEMRVP
jgi:hypothetical protein